MFSTTESFLEFHKIFKGFLRMPKVDCKQQGLYYSHFCFKTVAENGEQETWILQPKCNLLVQSQQ